MDSKSKLVIGATALSLFLAACSSTHTIKQEATFESDGVVKQVLNEVPQWYIDAEVKKGLITNRDADQFIYGVGTSVSPDLQLAINKATMVAKADLADQLFDHAGRQQQPLLQISNVAEGLAAAFAQQPLLPLWAQSQRLQLQAVGVVEINGGHLWIGGFAVPAEQQVGLPELQLLSAELQQPP